MEGTYEADGGWVEGPVEFNNTTLRQLASPAHPSILTLRGTPSLTTDNFVGTTLWVRSNCAT